MRHSPKRRAGLGVFAGLGLLGLVAAPGFIGGARLYLVNGLFNYIRRDVFFFHGFSAGKAKCWAGAAGGLT